MSRYNGYPNFETWQAALWLCEADTLGRLQAEDVKSVDAETLENLVLDMLPENPGRLLGDILSSWLSCVDFHELVILYNTDLED